MPVLHSDGGRMIGIERERRNKGQTSESSQGPQLAWGGGIDLENATI